MDMTEEVCTKPDVRSDLVFIRNVSIQAIIGVDCWSREKPQPAQMSLRIAKSVEQAGKTDKIEDTLDYRRIYKYLTSLDGSMHTTVHQLALAACRWALSFVEHNYVECVVKLPKALLQSDGITYDLAMRRDFRSVEEVKDVFERGVLSIKDLQIACIIGIGAHERLHKQPVIVNLKLDGRFDSRQADLASHFGGIFKRFETSHFLTLEAFVSAIAQYVVVDLDYPDVTVMAYKPSVFAAAEGPGVEIFRSKKSYPIAIEHLKEASGAKTSLSSQIPHHSL